MTKKPPTLTVIDPASKPDPLAPPASLGKAGAELWRSIITTTSSKTAPVTKCCCGSVRPPTLSPSMTNRSSRDGVTIRAKGSVREHPLLKHRLAAQSFIVRSLHRLNLDVVPARNEIGQAERRLPGRASMSTIMRRAGARALNLGPYRGTNCWAAGPPTRCRAMTVMAMVASTDMRKFISDEMSADWARQSRGVAGILAIRQVGCRSFSGRFVAMALHVHCGWQFAVGVSASGLGTAAERAMPEPDPLQAISEGRGRPAAPVVSASVRRASRVLVAAWVMRVSVTQPSDHSDHVLHRNDPDNFADHWGSKTSQAP